MGNTQKKEDQMICNICSNEITKEEEAIYCLPFGAFCEDCSNEIESSKQYEPKKITPEQLEKVKTILNNQEGN
jgi:predicted amidophosphoribosyltransferase